MSKNTDIRPPNWASRFLHWYCNPNLIEEIEGDLVELFQSRVEGKGKSKASLSFIWDVFRFFRWSNIKKSKSIYRSNNIAMIGNYFKVSWRSMIRNAMPSFLNIFGLSITVGIAIVGFLYLDWQYSLDSFHGESKNIYQVISYMDRNESIDEWGTAPITLGPAMQSDISVVNSMVRIERGNAIVRHEQNVFKQRVHFVDDSFFKIFDFPIVNGNGDALSQKTNVTISQQMAEKYFGLMDPVGKELLITLGQSEKFGFTVGAVFNKKSSRSSMLFDILLPYSNIETFDLLEQDNWAVDTDGTFVLLPDQVDPPQVEALMSRYVELQNEANDDFKMTKFRLQPLESLSVNSYKIGNSISFGNQPTGNLFLGIMSALLLLLACINYMNIAIGSVSRRLKEIALRKVIGSGKGDIIKQFLFENVLLCLFALIIGTILAKALLLPGFNSQVPFDIPFQFSSSFMAVGFFLGLLFFTAIVSGGYPAFYVSRFTAIDIFRGKERFGRKSWLSKTLLTIQFVLAFWTILSGLIFSEATMDMQNKEWGYNQDNLVVVPIKNEKHYTGIQEALSQHSGIISLTGSANHIGLSYAQTAVEINNEKKVAMIFSVGKNYLESMEVPLYSGRFFETDSESDKLESILVNEEFVKMLGQEKPIGYQIKENDKIYTIIGVVKDFHYNDFYQKVLPVVIHYVDEQKYNYVVAKVEKDNIDQVAQLTKDSWKTIEPDLPYEGIKQSEVFDPFFQNMKANTRLILFFSVMALILSCMGLFGLVTFNTNRRLKEFSIHRVFGAGTGLISRKITFDFFWLLIVGLILGTPLGFYSMDSLLVQILPDKDPITMLPFILGIGIVLATAIATVLSQILKVLRRNPANVLRE